MYSWIGEYGIRKDALGLKKMTHLYIKLCDLCGKPCEVDSGMHGGHISADVLIQKGKVSRVAFREEFDLCIECLHKTGLGEVLQKMKIMKESNVKKKFDFRKMLERKKILYQ
jgi:hypothetical protein